MDMIWTIVDFYRRGVLLARERCLESEAMAHSRLGVIYHKVGWRRSFHRWPPGTNSGDQQHQSRCCVCLFVCFWRLRVFNISCRVFVFSSCVCGEAFGRPVALLLPAPLPLTRRWKKCILRSTARNKRTDFVGCCLPWLGSPSTMLDSACRRHPRPLSLSLAPACLFSSPVQSRRVQTKEVLFERRYLTTASPPCLSAFRNVPALLCRRC